GGAILGGYGVHGLEASKATPAGTGGVGRASVHTITDNPLFQPLGPAKQPLSTNPESDSDDSVTSHKTMAQNRTLKELVAPNLDQQPLCIHYAPLDVNFELNPASSIYCQIFMDNYLEKTPTST
uniref:Uncharacterized protein n=1 Tax=Cannabis sativa TaxID=3483 RepID=A0A803QRD7_CANSA